MRFIKLALLSFVFFFALITAMSLLIPSHIRLSRAVTISSSSSVRALQLTADRNEWSRWHPAFQQKDINALLQKNRITIRPGVKTDSLVTVFWQQEGKAPVRNGWQLHRFAAPDSAALQWYMDFQLQWYPWQKFGSLFYEKTYGVQMEQGLKNIENLVQ